MVLNSSEKGTRTQREVRNQGQWLISFEPLLLCLKVMICDKDIIKEWGKKYPSRLKIMIKRKAKPFCFLACLGYAVKLQGAMHAPVQYTVTMNAMLEKDGGNSWWQVGVRVMTHRTPRSQTCTGTWSLQSASHAFSFFFLFLFFFFLLGVGYSRWFVGS